MMLPEKLKMQSTEVHRFSFLRHGARPTWLVR